MFYINIHFFFFLRLVVPYENLNAESAFYWSWTCSKMKSIEAKQKTSFSELEPNGNDDDDLDYLDKLVPPLTVYCEYVQEYDEFFTTKNPFIKISNTFNLIKIIKSVFKKMEEECTEQSNQDNRKHIENVFITKQLINMFVYIDFSDPHGK